MGKDPIYFLTENALLIIEEGTKQKNLDSLVALYFILLADEDQTDGGRYYHNQTTSEQTVDKIGKGRSHV
jgi:hypothetical protein